MRAWWAWLVVLAGCGAAASRTPWPVAGGPVCTASRGATHTSSIAVRGLVTLSASPSPLSACWVVTQPTLTGRGAIAAANGELYVLDCGAGLTVLKLEPSGQVAWRRRLGDGCSGFDRGAPIAADERGVVVAVPSRGDGRGLTQLVALDRAGVTRWERHLRGALGELDLAASGDRVALMVSPRAPLDFEGRALELPGSGSGYVVVELDGAGARTTTHALTQLDRARLSYDAAHHLWVNALFAEQVLAIDGVTQPITDGGWAVRLTGGPIIFPLFHDDHGEYTFVTAWPTGFATARYQGELAFVDHTGERRWQIELTPDAGCSLNPTVLDASPTRVLVVLGVFCGMRGGTARFGDVVVADRSTNIEELASGALVIELDPIAMHARSVRDLFGAGQLTEVGGAFGLVAHGEFQGELGLATAIHTVPASYSCVQPVPSDSPVGGTMYFSRVPLCDDGYQLHTEYPAWQFVATLR